jgi:hypothetical protein
MGHKRSTLAVLDVLTGNRLVKADSVQQIGELLRCVSLTISSKTRVALVVCGAQDKAKSG